LIFGTVNLDIGPYTLLIPILVTGFALSFVFVPLATLSTSTLTREEMGNATGLFNMLRNIGGSIGIAMASTALIRRAAFHQTEIGSNITASGWVLQQKSAQISGYLAHRLGPVAARPGSMGLLYGLLEQQSALKAYVDVFRWTALLAFFCAGAVWLFKKPIKHAPLPPGVH
jgi:DHA2 family multidrug resistance protein